MLTIWFSVPRFARSGSGHFRPPCLFVALVPRIQYSSPLRGAMGGISVILVKNHFFILLNKFNLHTIIYDSLKFQASITVVQSFIRSYVNFCAINYLIRGDLNPIFLNFHFLSILTNSKCKGFYNFQAIKFNFFLHVPQSMVTKTYN